MEAEQVEMEMETERGEDALRMGVIWWLYESSSAGRRCAGGQTGAETGDEERQKNG
jgi:hypothetical protein